VLLVEEVGSVFSARIHECGAKAETIHSQMTMPNSGAAEKRSPKMATVKEKSRFGVRQEVRAHRTSSSLLGLSRAADQTLLVIHDIDMTRFLGIDHAGSSTIQPGWCQLCAMFLPDGGS